MLVTTTIPQLKQLTHSLILLRIWLLLEELIQLSLKELKELKLMEGQ